MSNQVYSSNRQKYFASRGTNSYTCPLFINIGPGEIGIIGTIAGPQEDPQSTFILSDDDHLVCQVDGVYAITGLFNYGRSDNTLGPTATEFRLTIDYGEGYVIIASSFIQKQDGSGITAIINQTETLTTTLFLTNGDRLQLLMINRLTSGDITCKEPISLMTIQRIV